MCLEVVSVDGIRLSQEQDIHNIEQLRSLMRELIRIRQGKGITQAEIAQFFGTTEERIIDLEIPDPDPYISTIMAYALAVGARIDVRVSDFEDAK